MGNSKSDKRTTLSSVDNALRILQAFSIENPELGITELSHLLHLSTSSTHRLVQTLTNNGFLVQDPHSRKYRLSVNLLRFSGIISSQFEIYREALPVIRELVDSIQETAHIAVVEDTNVLYLIKEDCRYPIALPSYVGGRLPIHCTSSGRAILAYQPENVVEKSLHAAQSSTYAEHTITNPEILKELLQEVRKNGYSISNGTLVKNVVSIGFPIWDYTGNVVAALNVSGPIQRVTRHNVSRVIRSASRAADKISKLLGY